MAIYLQGHEAGGQDVALLNNLRWGCDYLIKCHYDASDIAIQNSLVAQVGGGSESLLGPCEGWIKAHPF